MRQITAVAQPLALAGTLLQSAADTRCAKRSLGPLGYALYRTRRSAYGACRWTAQRISLQGFGYVPQSLWHHDQRKIVRYQMRVVRVSATTGMAYKGGGRGLGFILLVLWHLSDKGLA